MTTTAEVHRQPIILLSVGYETLGVLSMQRAARLLHLGKAEVVEADPSGRLLRHWPWPLKIRLVYYVKLSYQKLFSDAVWSKRGVLTRDNKKCGYCGKAADTIDHIIPRSRGGGNTWMNTVACCFRCNNSKDNRMPLEAHMTLRIPVYVPTRAQLRGVVG